MLKCQVGVSVRITWRDRCATSAGAGTTGWTPRSPAGADPVGATAVAPWAPRAINPPVNAPANLTSQV